MNDTAMASDLLDEVIGYRGIREPIKAMLERAYRDLFKINAKWTRRRVRAVWEQKAQRIEHREIVEMQTILEARKRHAARKEETANRIAMAIARASNSDGGSHHPLG